MTSNKEIEAYIQSYGAKVPDEWFLWRDQTVGDFLVLSRDSDGRVFGHMIDDEKFNAQLAKYLKARGAKQISGLDQLEGDVSA